MKNIVVTGSTGFLGQHLIPVLESVYGADNVIGLSTKDFDLLDPDQVKRMFEVHEPEVLIHLVAYSGGIGANRLYPADFYYKNSLFVTLMFEAAARHGVRKMIYPMGGCSYPATAISPISEDQMWNGYPQTESAGYSVAKKMGIVASESYRQQYGLNSVVLIPGNMYGEYDNFSISESHVVPAMVRRYYETKLSGEKEIVMWGDGAPVRDFVYAGDVAKIIPWFIENYDSSEPVNISSGTKTSIKELAETVKKKMGWDGEIKWDTSKPNGQMIKIFDVIRLRNLGLACDTSLAEGLDKTIQWLEKNYSARTDGIRL
ncbi:NAD-dependent epimerase/dehydratase family protein [Candidatus Thiosymbion oneisti]|uniref:NAD-dependent epimerase/dehydratase family protein n=1 Tax=Candidatus Thiosymbion oneisti TaxID=589554 RepID=UPI00105F0B18|nr:NAD-dependent epimerase/dehydratase family protein [Candidatus Thiosymbion oneisti]